MRIQILVYSAGLAMCFLGASAARSADGWATAIPPPARSTDTISAAKLAQVKPGTSTKAEVQSLLGAPWRILQFNDCGMSMPGQADESWDYRGKMPRAPTASTSNLTTAMWRDWWPKSPTMLSG